MRFSTSESVGANGAGTFAPYRMETSEHENDTAMNNNNKKVQQTFKEFTEHSSLQGLKQVTSSDFHSFRR